VSVRRVKESRDGRWKGEGEGMRKREREREMQGNEAAWDGGHMGEGGREGEGEGEGERERERQRDVHLLHTQAGGRAPHPIIIAQLKGGLQWWA
jgi:hypothetical protein